MSREADSTAPSIDSLNLKSSTMAKISAFEALIHDEGYKGDAITWFSEHGTRLSLNEVGRLVGLSHHSIKDLFEKLSLPTPTRSQGLKRTYTAHPEYGQYQSEKMSAAMQSDEDKRRRFTEGGKRRRAELLEDDEYREANKQRQAKVNRRTWADPGFRARHSEAMVRYWEDSDNVKEASDRAKQDWQRADFREAVMQKMSERLSDPLFHQLLSDTAKRGWENPQRRVEQAERMRQVREDPLFVARQAEAIDRMWSDPGFRARNAQALQEYYANPDVKQQRAKRASQTMRANWEKPEFREKMSALATNLWQDPNFLERYYEGLQAMWQNPKYRIAHAERSSERMKRRWQDPDFRERILAAVREVQIQMNAHMNRPVRSISGERGDIGFAQSNWEANIARIFRLIGRSYQSRKAYPLSVPEEIRTNFPDYFSEDEAVITLDFTSQTSNGQIVVHEIMASPFKDPRGIIKLELLRQQYPELKIVSITENTYKRLSRRFRKRIMEDPSLRGWETDKYHLNSNPEVFS